MLQERMVAAIVAFGDARSCVCGTNVVTEMLPGQNGPTISTSTSQCMISVSCVIT